ncbi:type II secretion system protein N [Candidatus Symbiobacter mobilis]|uniref:Type II secretion system protein GspC N-terminal domain-containing protein n=1 Tax=Candidatus Symbiobacter mobilis CR TaxID=946483 RepID=U5N7A6_9BURK|nr:type II secretion system protein N [Candidatus Symbiobacter mobilis]AGX87190.1 hypothetical protein Cenrod_1097 [Candidatus Symbiobacter mobilis CR]
MTSIASPAHTSIGPPADLLPVDPSLSTPGWLPKLSALLLAALATASMGYWAARWRDVPAPFDAASTAEILPTHRADHDDAAQGKLAQLLGASQNKPASAPAPAKAASTRFKLLGVIAQGARGRALIAVDGAPPQPFGVGQVVADTLVLHAVSPRTVDLAPQGQDTATVTLELPPLPTAATSAPAAPQPR